MRNLLKMIRYRLEYVGFLVLKKMFLCFPEKCRFKLAEVMANFAYMIIKKRRIIALTNLEMAFPNMPENERIKIAKKSYQIMAKGFLSSLWIKEYLDNPQNIKIINKEVCKTAYNKNKGVVCALMHTGNIDITCCAASGLPMVAVAKRQKNPYINSFIMEFREKTMGLTIILKNKYVIKKLIEFLKKGYMLGLFCDHRDKGAIVNFFGTKTIAPTGAVSLALKYDIPLLFLYNVLDDDNTCTINIQEEIELVKTGNFKEDVQTNVQMLIDKMEKVISEHPEQWMWFHDRWNLYRKLYQNKKRKNK
ncbi:MAG: lysophospholipid acyltransferase family protein [Fusobacteriaceae bacterium]|nr:lysophospholipid acyltransferase family protein [Fusobacteriaceae bacterium]